MKRVGVISDTHGLLRPEALEALGDSDLIIHAGDVGDEMILTRLKELAPTYAVRGNVDTAAWGYRLPLTELIEIEDASLYVYHGHHELDIDPVAAGVQAVIFGHSHHPSIETRNGVLYINPGSAGRKRFDLPVSVARIKVEGAELEAELIYLQRG